MSNHYDVYCEEPTCPSRGDRLGLDLNHGALACETIVAERAVFEEMAKMKARLAALPDCLWLEFHVQVQWSQDLDLSFFEMHAGHRLRVRSEYGYASDECGIWPSSGASDRGWCSLPKGHAGEDPRGAPPEIHRFDGCLPRAATPTGDDGESGSAP